jgi:hypothetical protein
MEIGIHADISLIPLIRQNGTMRSMIENYSESYERLKHGIIIFKDPGTQ